VAISVNGEIAAVNESHVSNSHAEKITSLCQQSLFDAGISFSDLNAIAVSQGPGSYTGLRIGVSTAKGFCYALDIPLISISTLRGMALGMKKLNELPENALICPMIDARRMEVYNAIYTLKLDLVSPVAATIVDENSFLHHLTKHPVYFAGDGASKCQQLLSKNKNAYFIHEFLPSARWIAELAVNKYLSADFENTAYFEPFYLKDFIAGIPRIKGLT
jgi:tRNA threonylcarbamoyladenosine biosynthesis protein TsaB